MANSEAQTELSKLASATINVVWMYGQYVLRPIANGGFVASPPSFLDLRPLDHMNKAVNRNSLQIPKFQDHKMFYQPNRRWYFVAAVYFSTREFSLSATVPFSVTVKPMLLPSIMLRAPTMIQGTTGGFIVD